jgi:hypothetical protein
MGARGRRVEASVSLWLVIKSTEARIEERYTRTGPDTIELRMTLLFSGLTEGICAPMNEVDTYNKLFREPTSKGGGRK